MAESRPARRVRVPGTVPPIAAIRRDAEFKGLLILQGPARIDGRVSGEIVSDETVWIGTNARIEATVTAVNVIVAGYVRGDVRASGRIALESTAHVTGELTAERLVLVEGSHLEGTCRAGDNTTESKPAHSRGPEIVQYTAAKRVFES